MACPICGRWKPLGNHHCPQAALNRIDAANARAMADDEAEEEEPDEADRLDLGFALMGDDEE